MDRGRGREQSCAGGVASERGAPTDAQKGTGGATRKERPEKIGRNVPAGGEPRNAGPGVAGGTRANEREVPRKTEPAGSAWRRDPIVERSPHRRQRRRDCSEGTFDHSQDTGSRQVDHGGTSSSVTEPRLVETAIRSSPLASSTEERAIRQDRPVAVRLRGQGLIDCGFHRAGRVRRVPNGPKRTSRADTVCVVGDTGWSSYERRVPFRLAVPVVRAKHRRAGEHEP